MRLWPVVSGVAWRTMKIVITTPALLVPSILFPLFFFTAFAGGLSQVRNVPGFDFQGDYTSFQFVFVLLQSAAFGGVFTGFGVARDFEGGFARRLLLASPNRFGIVIGYGLAAVLRWSITATLLTVIALVVGMDIGGNAVDIIGLYTLALLVNLCGFAWSAGIAMRLRTMQAGPLMQMPVFLTLFFAPVYVPLDLLSGAMHTVARVNPVTYILESGRGFISGDPIHVMLAFVLALALVAVFAAWAFRGLRVAEAAGA
jgi:ABC-type multidrug transport system permease subunit